MTCRFCQTDIADNALICYSKALSNNIQIGNVFLYAVQFLNIAVIRIAQQQYTSADWLLERALAQTTVRIETPSRRGSIYDRSGTVALATTVDRDRLRTERGDECVQRPVALRLGRRDRRQEPRRAVEELAVRVRRPARVRAADRVPADEAPVAAGRPGDGALRRADVGHRAGLNARAEDGGDLRGKRGNRRRNDGDRGAGDRLLDVGGRLVERATLGRGGECRGVGIEACDRLDAGPFRGQADRGADQPGADDRHALHGRHAG